MSIVIIKELTDQAISYIKEIVSDGFDYKLMELQIRYICYESSDYSKRLYCTIGAFKRCMLRTEIVVENMSVLILQDLPDDVVKKLKNILKDIESEFARINKILSKISGEYYINKKFRRPELF